MRNRKEPELVDDGLLVYKNVSVYVCDADDPKGGVYDVHLNIGDDGELEHIMFDNTSTLYDRWSLDESWRDAAEWLRETATTLQVAANWIDEHMDMLGTEVDE